jgi:hypothetical protein
MVPERNATVAVPGTWDVVRKINQDVVNFPSNNSMHKFESMQSNHLATHFAVSLHACRGCTRA